jgi:hypothetical protein
LDTDNAIATKMAKSCSPLDEARFARYCTDYGAMHILRLRYRCSRTYNLSTYRPGSRQAAVIACSAYSILTLYLSVKLFPFLVRSAGFSCSHARCATDADCSAPQQLNCAACHNTIQHWQLRDLMAYDDETSVIYTACGAKIVAFNLRTKTVCPLRQL